MYATARRGTGCEVVVEPELFGREDVVPRLHKLLTYLGYHDSAYYVDARSGSRTQTVDHALSIGIDGAFCLPSATASGSTRLIPIVYVAAAADRQEADRLHREVWSQDLVPVLVIATRVGVEIRNAFDPKFSGRSVPWEVVEGRRPNQDLAAVEARNLVAAVAWRDFSHRTARRVDEHLLRAVRGLSSELGRREPALAGVLGLVNALIGRMLYLLVLIDRGIVTQSWVDGLRHDTGEAPSLRVEDDPLRRSPWRAVDTWLVMDRIDMLLNGSVFPIAEGARELVSEEALEFVRNVLRHDAVVEGQVQLGFVKVSYRSIRSETLSALYELFLSMDDHGDKKDAGAFYTPPYLADYVLDETAAVAKFDARSVVCDPACGSGIFLVGAFRRIVEASGAAGNADALRKTMRDCIFGIERNRQAAAVTRFSLYLTMLDYLPSFTLEETDLGCDPLFPPMTDNIVEQDFFEAQLPDALAGRATHVVANPPWTPVAKGSVADKAMSAHADWPASSQRLAELFVWAARERLAAEGAVLSMLLSTRSFVSASAGSFPAAIASKLRLRGLVNLSHFRYRLFRNARNPATLMVAVADAPDGGHVWISAPLLTSQPLGPGGRPWAIAIDRGDVTHVRPADLLDEARGWFWHLILRPVDRRYAQLLTERAAEDVGRRRTFGSFLERHGMSVRNGDSVRRTGLDFASILGADPNQPNFYRKALGLDGGGKSHQLSTATLETLSPTYRELYAGPVLLVGRGLSHFDVAAGPVAFNSSLNAVYFRGRSRVPASDKKPTLGALQRFFHSELACYLFALFGRSWILDRRRFETEDLKAMPFPFETIDELLEQKPHQVLETFCEAFGLDPAFSAVAREYSSFRKDYEDGGIPPDALLVPSEEIKDIYDGVLIDRVKAHLGNIDVSIARRAVGAQAKIEINLDASPTDGGVLSEAPPAEYAWSSSVSFDAATGAVLLSKPLIRSAWTVERAFADAERITAAILAA